MTQSEQSKFESMQAEYQTMQKLVIKQRIDFTKICDIVRKYEPAVKQVQKILIFWPKLKKALGEILGIADIACPATNESNN